MLNIVLERFMIFNASEGRDESREGEKLLYHWAKNAPDHKVSQTEQIDDICLCDATISASIRLNSDIDGTSSTEGTRRSSLDDDNEQRAAPDTNNNRLRCLQLNFDKTIITVIEVEPQSTIWFAVRVGTQSKSSSSSSLTQSNDSQQAQSNDQVTQSNPQQSNNSVDISSNIPSAAIERVVKNIYYRFCLLNGTFQMIASSAKEQAVRQNENIRSDELKSIIRNKLRHVCNKYFHSVLPEIHLTSSVTNIVALYNYIFYLDLNPVTLMKVNSFINHLVCINAEQIRHTIAIFNDQLLWSSMNMIDTRMIYNYMVSTLIRDALQEELSKEVDKVRKIVGELPVYLYDGPNGNCGSNCFEKDLCDIRPNNGILTKYYLTVFRSSNNMTLALILKDDQQTELIRNCELVLTSDSRLGVIPLASLAQTVGQHFLKSNAHAGAGLQAGPSQTSSNQAGNFSASSSTVSSGMRKRQQNQANNVVALKNFVQTSEQKYLCLNHLSVSVCWPKGMDLHGKEHQLLLDNSGNLEIPASSKNRLIKLLIDLDPEFDAIEQHSSHRVEEFIGKSTNDCWFLVTNSRYKSIYSIHKARNASLNDALQCATNLKSALACNRP